jgi:hypothetical protein
LELLAEYRYAHLEQVPGAAELIGHFSGSLWRSPEEFEGPLPVEGSHLGFRWRSSSETAGVATLRDGADLISLSLLACGVDPERDTITLKAFQRHLLEELRDTGFEPAFALMDLKVRPLSATINFQSPTARVDQVVAALADRSFAAAYFRYHALA